MLHQRVTRLRARFESFEAAALAFRAAEYDECLASLHDARTLGEIVLRVRCLIRLRRQEEALSEIAIALGSAIGTAYAAELLTLRGSAELSLGQSQRAEETLTEARVKAYLSGSPVLEAEAEYSSALLYWSQNRQNELERAVQRVLAVSVDGYAWLPEASSTEHIGILSEIRAKAYDLLGALAAVRENFDEQASLIAMAFEELETVSDPDRLFESRLLFNLAGLCRDLDLPDSYDFVAKRVAEIPFAPHTKLYEFHIRRCLGWCNANRGNHVGALREFRLSAEAAPSLAWRMVAVLDRALLARELHEQHFAQEELDYALRLCRSVDWAATREEECFALFVLAQHVAPLDPVEARRLLDHYESMKGTLPATSYGNKDRRLYAEVAYASAVVLRSEGQVAAATRLLLDCFEVWTQIGYLARAAVAAADLAELTEERYYFSVAAREAEKRPQSWLASRLRAISVSKEACTTS